MPGRCGLMTSLWLADKSEPLSTLRDIEGVRESSDVVVVGAGITGLTTAVLLARAGKRVTVVEAQYVGAGATGNTTGKVSLLQGTKLSRIATPSTGRKCCANMSPAIPRDAIGCFGTARNTVWTSSVKTTTPTRRKRAVWTPPNPYSAAARDAGLDARRVGRARGCAISVPRRRAAARAGTDRSDAVSEQPCD